MAESIQSVGFYHTVVPSLAGEPFTRKEYKCLNMLANKQWISSLVKLVFKLTRIRGMFLYIQRTRETQGNSLFWLTFWAFFLLLTEDSTMSVKVIPTCNPRGN